MKKEIDAALKFIIKLIRQNSDLSDAELARFQHSLRIFLTKKFINHWHPERPWQGQGYRCLRLNEATGKEPTIAKAATECGLEYSHLKLPLELTVWVDPGEVACRFGEHKGSYCTVASFQDGKKQNYIDLDLFKITTAEKENNCMKTKHFRKSNPSASPLEDFSSKENRGAVTSTLVLPHPLPNSSTAKTDQFRPSNSATENVNLNQISFQDSLYLEPCSLYHEPSWIRFPNSISPSFGSYPSSDQYALNLASQERFTLNKLTWNADGLYQPQRNGWYSHRQLARV